MPRSRQLAVVAENFDLSHSYFLVARNFQTSRLGVAIYRRILPSYLLSILPVDCQIAWTTPIAAVQELIPAIDPHRAACILK